MIPQVTLSLSERSTITVDDQVVGDFKKQQQQQPNSKAVSFHPNCTIHIVESTLNLIESKQDVWYTPTDYQIIRWTNQQQLNFAKFSQLDIAFRPAQYRGLERSVDESRRPNRKRCIDCVLVNSKEDVDTLAYLYHINTISSTQKAIRLGQMDEQDAQIALEESWTQPAFEFEYNVDSSRSVDSDISSSDDSIRNVHTKTSRSTSYFTQRRPTTYSIQ
jgi:hypothetical protein